MKNCISFAPFSGTSAFFFGLPESGPVPSKRFRCEQQGLDLNSVKCEYRWKSSVATLGEGGPVLAQVLFEEVCMSQYVYGPNRAPKPQWGTSRYGTPSD
jgi:hypothetical protein